MFSEEELLPISSLQHLVFCERRAALILMEGVWEENRYTAEGRNLHDRVNEPGTESRRNLRVSRSMRLRSLRLGITGIADVVEFHRMERPAGVGALGDSKVGVALAGVQGSWLPFPVEYKRGRMRKEESYEIQLCAQAICLEEMLGGLVPSGALFYGQPRKRLDVAFTEDLRKRVETAAFAVHDLLRSGRTPAARYEKKCESCSLINLCLPKVTGGQNPVDEYLARAIAESEGTPPR